MNPNKYVCIIQSLFNHEIKTANSVDAFPKRIKDFMANKANDGEWVLFKAGDDGKIHRCYSNGRKLKISK